MFNILSLLFGCFHKDMTFPITVKPGQRKNPAAKLTGTYVVCKDCGREFPYDWERMKIVSERDYRKHLIPRDKPAA